MFTLHSMQMLIIKLSSRSSFPNLVQVPICSRINRVGLESNNAMRKKEKYLNLISEMSRNYVYICVRFVNLSMNSLGVFSDECSTFLDMMNDIGSDKKQKLRATYYIFCCRNRNWDRPDLVQFWFCCCCCCCFLFNNPISSSICKFAYT